MKSIPKAIVHQMTEDVHSSYDSEFRFLSYWKQIELVMKRKPKKILYVGVGTGFMPDYLKKCGYVVETADVDAQLKPDYVIEIGKLSSLGKKYDLVMVCEVLEHIPLSDVPRALENIAAVARACIISVPENRSKLWFSFKIPLIPEQKLFIPLPFFPSKVTNIYHYWELNPKTQKQLENAFLASGWRVCARERVVKLTSHMFYELER